MSAECGECGVAAGDLPYEQMGLSLDEMAEQCFENVDGRVLCQGCANSNLEYDDVDGGNTDGQS